MGIALVGFLPSQLAIKAVTMIMQEASGSGPTGNEGVDNLGKEDTDLKDSFWTLKARKGVHPHQKLLEKV